MSKSQKNSKHQTYLNKGIMERRNCSMIIEPPLMFGAEEKHIICKQCGKEINIPATITVKEFDELPPYIDGFKKGLEDKYFEYKFFGCDNCGWFFKAPRFDKCVYGDKPTEKIKKVLDSNIDVTEKRCLINYMINKDTNSLLELYWYYDIKAKDEIKAFEYRKELVKILSKVIKQKPKNFFNELSYIDMLRRNREFEKAIKFMCKNIPESFLTNNDECKLEMKLCKEKNSDRY